MLTGSRWRNCATVRLWGAVGLLSCKGMTESMRESSRSLSMESVGKLLSTQALSSQCQFTSPVFVAPSGKHRIALSPQSHQCGPTLGAKVCHQLLLLVVFTPTRSAARACRFHLQEVTAVVHGC